MSETSGEFMCKHTMCVIQLGFVWIDEPEDDDACRTHGKEEPVRVARVAFGAIDYCRGNERTDKSASLPHRIEKGEKHEAFGCWDLKIM